MRPVCLIVLALCTPAALAQSPLSLRPGSSGAAGLEVVRAENGGDPAASVAFLTGHVALSPWLGLVFDMPSVPSELGDPYVGIRRSERGGAWHQEVGVRLPLSRSAGRGPGVLGRHEAVAFERKEALRGGGMVLVALSGIGGLLLPYVEARVRAGAVARLASRQGDALLEAELTGAWRVLRLSAQSQARIGLTGPRSGDRERGAVLGARAALQLADVQPAIYVRTFVGEPGSARVGPQLGLSLSMAINR